MPPGPAVRASYRLTSIKASRRCRICLPRSAFSARCARMRPAIVDSHCTKAGLVGAIAGSLARVPIRIYHNHGMVLLSAAGLTRIVFRTIESLACKLSTRVIYVSRSNMEDAVALGVCRRDKATVLGPGTICGVDPEKFDPGKNTPRGIELRRSAGIPEGAWLCGFVGRIVPHKGIETILAAWRLLPAEIIANAYLCIFGGLGEPRMYSLVEAAAAQPRLHVKYMGFSNEMPAWYSSMALLVQPSWHEGWGYNVLESACSGVPAIGTRISATVDAILDGRTGVLVPVKDPKAMADAIVRLLKDGQLRRQLGEAARQRALREFSQESIVPLLLNEYRRLLARTGSAVYRMTRVLVTGATGFVGGTLCETLSQNGYIVRAALRADRSMPSWIEEKVVVGDIGQGTDWERALNGVVLVMHLAARAHIIHDSPANSHLYFDTNTQGTKCLAEASARAGVRRFVFLSSVKVNGESTTNRAYAASDDPRPEDDYGKSKWMAEKHVAQIAEHTGMAAVIVRAPLVYGPGVRANFFRLLRVVEKHWPLPLGAIHNRRSLVSIWNLCDFLVQVLQNPVAANRTWMISDGEDLSSPELIRRIGRAMGRPVRLLPIPPSLLTLIGVLAGRRQEIARICGSLAVDVTQTRRELGWAPAVTVDEAIARTVTWYLSLP